MFCIPVQFIGGLLLIINDGVGIHRAISIYTRIANHVESVRADAHLIDAEQLVADVYIRGRWVYILPGVRIHVCRMRTNGDVRAVNIDVRRVRA